MNVEVIHPLDLGELITGKEELRTEDVQLVFVDGKAYLQDAYIPRKPGPHTLE